MKAVVGDTVIAEAPQEDLIQIEGNNVNSNWWVHEHGDDPAEHRPDDGPDRAETRADVDEEGVDEHDRGDADHGPGRREGEEALRTG
ncbi:hypothetical protein IAE22_28265, partial [Bacillus sp. S34]|nr:hypothetical protein [Bacillus sp. S34]